MTNEHKEKIRQALLKRNIGKTPDKLCPRCGVIFPRETFQVRPNGHTFSYCTPCHLSSRREIALRAHYNPKNRERIRRQWRKTACRRKGITLEEYEIMEKGQDGLCAICKKTNGNKHLFIDHCHTTNKVRGLLCSNCNRAIGLLYDDIKSLKRAINYLQKN